MDDDEDDLGPNPVIVVMPDDEVEAVFPSDPRWDVIRWNPQTERYELPSTLADGEPEPGE